MIYHPLQTVPQFRYGAILIDCPWLFKNWSEKGEGKNPVQHYDCMNLDEIMALPVGHWAASDCLLTHWVTGPMLPQGIEAMKRWGFEYVTIGFIWPKRSKSGKKWHFGTGYYTRQGGEIALFGKIGNPKILDHGVPQLIEAPVRQNSRKPDEIYERIQRLVAGPYLEVFGRQEWPGWDVTGNEVGKFAAAAAAE